MTGKRLRVWFEDRLVGTLSQDLQGDLGFAYDAAWLSDPEAPEISMSLPKRVEPYPHKACQPFFDGLLPEGGQRQAVAKALGVSERNPYALLHELGGDVAGALEFLPSGAKPKALTRTWKAHPFDDAELLAVLDRLPLRPMLAGEDGLRLSLAGAQAKLPVCLVEGRISRPEPGQPTTHILKPPIPNLRASTENEAFAMNLAAALGINVAIAEPRIIATPKGLTRTFLLVDRYDRTVVHGRTRRVHQEDFCQAMGIPPSLKYQSEGGPNLKQCFELVQKASSLPAKDRLSLLDVVLFNVMIGNADAHGKNFSLLYHSTGLRLAPFYDLMSTAFYPDLSKGFAMKIGDQSKFERLGPRAWTQFAAQAGVTLPFVRKRILALAGSIPSAADSVVARLSRTGLDQEALQALSTFVKQRADRCAASIAAP